MKTKTRTKPDAKAKGKTAKPQPFTVAANLAYKWYDEIESGKKRTEYRDISDYWESHLFRDGRPAKFIKFSRGYTKTNRTWEVRRIDVDETEGLYMIRLGKRVE